MKKYIKKIIFFLIILNIFLEATLGLAYEHNGGFLAEEDFNQEDIIAYTQTDLLGGEIDGISVCRVGETNLGDLVADAMIDSVQNLLVNSRFASLPIVAMQNGGGIRQIIPSGAITQTQIDKTFPYGNYLTVHVVTPQLLYDILENGVSRIVTNGNGTLTGVDGRFPQVSGMRFIYDPSQPASNTFDELSTKQGSRILAIYLDDEEKVLDKNDTNMKIIFVCNNYCLDGGDGYTMLKKSNILYTGEAINKIVGQYISKIASKDNGNIFYETDRRIVVGEALGSLQKDIKLVINSELLECEDLPVIENNRVLLPMRIIFESLGAKVIWNDKSKLAVILENGNKIEVNMNENRSEINGQIIELDTQIKIINGRIMVPISFIKQTVSTNVEWDSKYNTVFIN